MEDTLVLGTSALRHKGSSPFEGTKQSFYTAAKTLVQCLMVFKRLVQPHSACENNTTFDCLYWLVAQLVRAPH